MRSIPRRARTPVWAPPVPLAATPGIDVSFFSSGYLDVSVRRVPLRALWIHARILEVPSSGFPHSDISGSMDICSSPKLFAAYHVFHRLLVPRHPPCALLSLSTRIYSVICGGRVVFPGFPSRRLRGAWGTLFKLLSLAFIRPVSSRAYPRMSLTTLPSLWEGQSDIFFSLYAVFKVRSISSRQGSPGGMGLSGLEPPTSRLSGVRSNLLSYKPLPYPM